MLDLCIPLVADFAVVFVDNDASVESSPVKSESISDYMERHTTSVLLALSRVRGKVLVISPRESSDMSSYNTQTFPTQDESTTVLPSLADDEVITEIKQNFKHQLRFLEVALPEVIHKNVLESCTYIAFRRDYSYSDDSMLLKNRSHFSVCNMNPKYNDKEFGIYGSQPVRELGLAFTKPSTAKFTSNNGINLAQLTNVCLANNKKEIYLLKEHSTDQILSQDLRDILRKTGSGFYPFDGVCGWEFSEVTGEELMVAETLSKSDILYFKGITALSSPAFAPQMIHTLQTLFPLLEAAMHPDFYPWINNLER